MKEPAVAKKGTSSVKKKASKGAKNSKSRVTVRLDVGFSNNLFIRGDGPGLSWERGVPLANKGPDEWVWESASACGCCEFKVLINDQVYEMGENHHLEEGSQIQYTPQF